MNRAVSLIAAMCLVLIWQGPVAAAGEYHVGVKGGMNIANQSDTNATDTTDSRNGLALGGYFGFPVHEMVTIQPEALFMMKGAEDTGTSSTMKLNYLEVPVLAKVEFQTGSSAQPSIFFGPAFGFNVTAKTEDITGTETDVKDQMKSVDVGMVVGGGLDFPIGTGTQNIGLDVRYSWGVSNVNDTTTGTEVKNNVFSIMGTWGFL